MIYFISDESGSMPGKYLIRPNFSKLPLYYTTGSYAILPARTMGLTYANYCRMCRDLYNAEIIGKKSYYPTVFFSSKKEADELIKVLDKRMEKIINGQ